ncbi:MAG: hypothetical protein L0271_07415 [Gemmatimonadetes bacterium]|nr:hypothetical protein [Gemmatimonadota bacterium]
MSRTPCVALTSLVLVTGCTERDDSRVRLATTPAIVEVGLAAALIERFQSDHPDLTIELLPAVEGAIEKGRRGQADVLLTHSPVEEARLVAEGRAIDRRVVMHSECVLLGPPEDPADVAGIIDIGEALRVIAATGMRYVSRAAEPGAARLDHAIWASIGVTPAPPWAIEAGPGIADALRLASAQRAYVLADLAGFLALAPTLDLEIVSQGDRRLIDTWAVLHIEDVQNPRAARVLADWLAGPDARAVIESFAKDPFGAPVFRGGAAPVGSAIVPRIRPRPASIRISIRAFRTWPVTA